MHGTRLSVAVASLTLASLHIAPLYAIPAPQVSGQQSTPTDTSIPWREMPASPLSAQQIGAATGIQPRKYRTLSLDLDQVRRQLDQGQALFGPNAGTKQSHLAIPLPEGGYSDFVIEDSGAMPVELAKKYPRLRSLKGMDAEGRHIRIDLAERGLVARVWDKQGAWHVQPVSGTAASHNTRSEPYMAYRDSDLPAERQPIDRDDITMLEHAFAGRADLRAAQGFTGDVLYDFRIAISTDSAYTKAFGGTVEGGLSGVVRAVNQINEIYENDLGVHFTLVRDNDKLIRTTPRDDPDGDPFQANIDLLNRMIGSSNYDVGHFFNTQFGGNAGAIGNTCLTEVTRTGQHKAAGYTGHPNPVGDPLFTLIFAHEMGHKLGAWHTFNGCGKSTLGDRAFEPGSGSTVMGYAGTGCGGSAQHLQSRMDPYFHAGSLQQMSAWLSSHGGQCAAKRLNTNSSAWIDPESIRPPSTSAHVIPANTPFVLDATVTHPNPAVRLSYSWEQMDVGPEQRHALTDDGGPIFRSYLPSEDSKRVFPRMAAVLGDESLGLGEIYPQTTRPLNFRLTARDNYGTLATTSSADARVNVLDTGKPFAVTAPKALSTWKMGATGKLHWDVASTREQPIHCTAVTAHLSVDGGYHYLDEPLAKAAPNVGSAEVRVPELSVGTARARVRISCDNNIFFAVSPGDFVIRK